MCTYDVSQEGERMILTNSDFFSNFNERRGGLNEIIPYFFFSFLPWTTVSWLSKISRCLGVNSPPTKDGPLLCGLTHSYNNFNLPTSLLSQVRLICHTPYIVSLYPQYILNFFTSLFTWPPGQWNSFTSPLKHLWKYTFSRILIITRQILKSSIIKASKYKVQDTTEVI